MATRVQVVFDCADVEKVGKFWAEALGYIEQPPPEGFPTWSDFLTSINVPEDQWDSGYAVVDPAGEGPRLFFQKVPEPKSTKNRVHLDLNVGGGPDVPLGQRRAVVEAEAQRLIALGATFVRLDEDEGFHISLLDVEGNEFDVQ